MTRVKIKKGKRNFGEFVALVRNVDAWCEENLQDDEWDILSAELDSVKKGKILIFYAYYEFKDPEVATLMSVKFGL